MGRLAQEKLAYRRTGETGRPRPGDLGDAIRQAIAANRPFLIDANVGADKNPGGAGVWELPGLGRSAPMIGCRHEVR